MSSTEISKIRPLSPELAQRATELFQENESRSKMILLKIKQWLSLQPHLKVRMDDQWLIAFVRGCKYSLEDIKKTLEGYYTWKTRYSDVFGNKRDPNDPVINHFVQSGTFLVCNNNAKNPTSPTIIIGRVEYNYFKYSLDEALKYANMLLDISLYENDNITINGAIEIFDLEKFHILMFSEITVEHITKIVRLIQDRLPISFNGIHYINAPLGFKTVIDVAKSIASSDLIRRIHVHDTIEDLHKYVSKADLPKEYGGETESLKDLKELWIQKFAKYRDWFIEDEQYYADESARIVHPNND